MSSQMEIIEEAAIQKATRIFWNVVESEIKTVIPLYIKNILMCYGYYSAFTIQLFKREQIPRLEMFVRCKMDLFIDKKWPFNKYNRDYYSVFYNDPKKFYIIEGHQDLIVEIVDFVKNKIRTHGLSFFTKDPKLSLEKTIFD